ncbi:MAG: translation initiation factor IF-2, partial [Verrucomicrobiota bacterium]
MPVRIYDIAKKLGLESKEVLVKAKELSIAAAKVPSSSLDKISAEWLEEEIIKSNPAVAARLAPKPVEEKPKPAPVEEKIQIIHAPEPEPVVEVIPDPAPVEAPPAPEPVVVVEPTPAPAPVVEAPQP